MTDLKESDDGSLLEASIVPTPNQKPIFSGCFWGVVSHTLIPKNIGSSHPKSLKKPRMGLMDDEL